MNTEALQQWMAGAEEALIKLEKRIEAMEASQTNRSVNTTAFNEMCRDREAARQKRMRQAEEARDLRVQRYIHEEEAKAVLNE